MITFRIQKHYSRSIEVVEVLLDGKMVAMIYPGDPHTTPGIRMISGYVNGVTTSLNPDEDPKIWAFSFDPDRTVKGRQ